MKDLELNVDLGNKKKIKNGRGILKWISIAHVLEGGNFFMSRPLTYFEILNC